MMPPFGFVVPTPDPRWVASLRHRRDVIHRLCSALEEYLADGIDAQIENLNAPPLAPIVTVEMLTEAVRSRDETQSKIDALTRLCEEVPDAQADFLRTLQLPLLESELKNANHQVEWIQKALENAEAA